MLCEFMFLVIMVYFLFMMMMYKKGYDMEEMSCYECGFDPGSKTRSTFSYRFFLISILFIIFDVEISLMLPIPYLMGSELGVFVFYFFLVILLTGLIYEYMCGSLEWMEILIKS